MLDILLAASGLAFLLLWSLCRAAARSDERDQRDRYFNEVFPPKNETK